MLASADIRELLAQQPIALPVFHPVALKLTLMLPDPYSDFDDIVRVISEDQALSAQVLKMSNSSAYMGLRKAETIKDSAIRLGVRQISVLAMAASQASLHTSDNSTINALMHELWQHSLACALGCWWIAQNTAHQSILEHAYLAGLLHDIGKLYLLKAMEHLSHNKELHILLDRKSLIGIFTDMHVEQGCRIMDHWNIPPIYRTVVANHHAESCDPVDTLLTIVRLVNVVSQKVNLSLDPVPRTTPEAEMLDLDETQMEKLGAVMTNYCDVSI
jgi:HD-like signal output (HDOD) protein